jgi:hypothetical protein
MNPIEYRFLQLILSHVTGDKLTLALLHWDGQRLRVASSFVPLSYRDVAQPDVVQQTVRAKLERAIKQAKQAPAGLGLKDAVPVREGLGAALYWAPIRTSLASNAQAHFQELCESLRLEAGATTAEAHEVG